MAPTTYAIHVNVNGPDRAGVIAALRRAANDFEGPTSASLTTEMELEPSDREPVVEPKRATTKATGTVKKAAKASEPPPEDNEDFDLGDTEATEATTPAFTKADVIKSFQIFAKANGREEAGKILKKLGVKSVQDLKPEVYGKAIALTEV